MTLWTPGSDDAKAAAEVDSIRAEAERRRGEAAERFALAEKYRAEAAVLRARAGEAHPGQYA